jgi:branched-chain amino acid transport system ATP-binding protein
MSGEVWTLDARSVSQSFGGLNALSTVSLQVEKGTVHGVIGPNGAGKTTFLNIVSGLQVPTSGQVMIGGRDVTGWKADRLARVGRVARTFQTAKLFSSMSVRENILTGAAIVAGGKSAALTQAQQVIDRFGLKEFELAPADKLPYGVQRHVELARALATRPILLLLDEPGAGLNPTERTELGVILRELASEGVAVVLVEHQMDLVRAACKIATVLDFGRVIASGTVDQVMAEVAVIEAYVGVARGKREV